MLFMKLSRLGILILIFIGWNSGAVIINPPYQGPTAKVVKAAKPDNCFNVSPYEVSLNGHLMGKIYNQDVRSPTGRLFLKLDKPISVCAFEEKDLNQEIPAYVDVRRIGMGNWSRNQFKFIIKKWGKDEIKIKGTLGNSALTGGQVGPIIFWSVKSICMRSIVAKRRSHYECKNWNTWLNSISGQ